MHKLSIPLPASRLIALNLLIASSLAAQGGSYFGNATPLGTAINAPRSNNAFFAPSQDELFAIFASDRAGGKGGYDLYQTRRKTLSDAWGNVKPLPFNTKEDDTMPAVSFTGKELYFCRVVGSARKIFFTRHTAGSWTTPKVLPDSVNGPGSTKDNRAPALTQDGLRLFYTQGDANGSNDRCYVSTRRSTAVSFSGSSVAVAVASMPAGNAAPTPKHNGKRLLFRSTKRDWANTHQLPGTNSWLKPMRVPELKDVQDISVGATTGICYETGLNVTQHQVVRIRCPKVNQVWVEECVDYDLELVFDPVTNTWLYVPTWTLVLTQKFELTTYDWSAPNLASIWRFSASLLPKPLPIPSISNGLLLDPTVLIPIGTTQHKHGLARLPLQVPNSARLIGLNLYAQAATVTRSGKAAFTSAGKLRIRR